MSALCQHANVVERVAVVNECPPVFASCVDVAGVFEAHGGKPCQRKEMKN